MALDQTSVTQSTYLLKLQAILVVYIGKQLNVSFVTSRALVNFDSFGVPH
jgi:hypothetical protein